MSGYSETWQVQFAYLLNKLRNAGTMLPGINGVEEIAPPIGGNLPLIGIQYLRTTELPGEAMHHYHQVNDFDCRMIFVADFDPTIPDALAELKKTAENALNDQAGHGLLPLLRGDATLGGFATYAGPASIDVQLGRNPENQAQISAHVAVTIRAEAELGPI